MSSGRPGRVSRPLALAAGAVLAVAATAVLVLTDELALLRLAVVGALWAFLIAAFVAGTRRPTPDAVSTEVTLRRSHELELEREGALRREAELNAEVRVRRELDNNKREFDTGLREDIAGLREDLQRLRQDIAERWDGELRVERVAVHAESTRVSGFGASFHALQDEARRLTEHGRPLFEVEAGKEGPAQRPVLVPAADALPGVLWSARDTASTVEFGVVTQDDTPEQERTGPVYGLPVPPPRRAAEPAEHADLGPDPEPVAPDTEPGPPGRRARSRHGAGDDAQGSGQGEDAADLVRRLGAETTGETPAITGSTGTPRRRRARDDGETNDVLSRVLGDR